MPCRYDSDYLHKKGHRLPVDDFFLCRFLCLTPRASRCPLLAEIPGSAAAGRSPIHWGEDSPNPFGRFAPFAHSLRGVPLKLPWSLRSGSLALRRGISFSCREGNETAFPFLSRQVFLPKRPFLCRERNEKPSTCLSPQQLQNTVGVILFV